MSLESLIPKLICCPFQLYLSTKQEKRMTLAAIRAINKHMEAGSMHPGGGGAHIERGYGDVRPWRPPFHASPAARKGPISSKRVSSQDPLLRKLGNFSLYSLNFCPNFSSQAPKFENLQLTSPQIGKFSVHKPPFSEASISSQAPHFGNLGRTPLPEKKVECPLREHAPLSWLL